MSLSPTLTLSDSNTPDSLLARSPDHSCTFSHSHYTPTLYHTQTHTLILFHSSHLLTVTIHVSLAVAKLQAPTKIFFEANKSLHRCFDRYPTLSALCFLRMILFSWLCFALVSTCPFTRFFALIPYFSSTKLTRCLPCWSHPSFRGGVIIDVTWRSDVGLIQWHLVCCCSSGDDADLFYC